MKRFFDFLFAFVGIIILSPILIIISILIKVSSSGDILYTQIRVGRNNKDFLIYKFRTMYVNAENKGLLTVGGRDPRITKIGYYLRKSKLDELPQLFNVLKGDMSFVGPRPEVRFFVNLYSENQKKILRVRPGITDVASIEFRNENEILEKQANPQKYYIDVIMPKKISINLTYLENRNLIKDFFVVLKTFNAILKN